MQHTSKQFYIRIINTFSFSGENRQHLDFDEEVTACWQRASALLVDSEFTWIGTHI